MALDAQELKINRSSVNAAYNYNFYFYLNVNKSLVQFCHLKWGPHNVLWECPCESYCWTTSDSISDLFICRYEFDNIYEKKSFAILLGNRSNLAWVHSFGHFKNIALVKAHTFTSWLKSARSEKREVGPPAVKSARLPMLLRKARAFDKINQN
jgi:hypothetical protein